MTRLVGPDEGSRLVLARQGVLARLFPGDLASFYSDAAATIPADIQDLAGAAIAGARLVLDDNSFIPLFKFPDNVDTIYVRVTSGGVVGPISPVYARTDDRLDAVSTALATLPGTFVSIPGVAGSALDILTVQTPGDPETFTWSTSSTVVARALGWIIVTDSQYAGGAVGDYVLATDTGTDSTAAFQAAITANAVVANWAQRPIYVPHGSYKVASSLTGIAANMRMVGANKGSTFIGYTGTGVMFPLGTYSTNPANMFGGTISGVTLENLWIMTPLSAYANEAARTATCIQDNGNGDVTLRRTEMRGFAYGFQASYGSDFTTFENADFYYNDVGAYFGPGSEQVNITGGKFFGNREGLITDRSPQGSVRGTWFIDSKVADVTHIYNSTTVRSGVNASVGLTLKDANWTFRDCWHESDADITGLRVPPQHVLTDGDQVGFPRGVQHVRPHLVSGLIGGGQSASNAFWRVNRGTQFELDGLTVYGHAIKYAVDVTTADPVFLQRLTTQSYTYTDLILWNGTLTDNQRAENCLGVVGTQGATTGRLVAQHRTIGDAFPRLTVRADGLLKWGSGAAAPDSNLYWGAVGTLITDTSLFVGGVFRCTSTGAGATLARFGVSGAGMWEFRNATGKRLLVGVSTSTDTITLDPDLGITLADKDLILSATTGTKIGTAATQKLGFYGATPIVRPTATPAAATDLATALTLVNDLRTKLLALGVVA